MINEDSSDQGQEVTSVDNHTEIRSTKKNRSFFDSFVPLSSCNSSSPLRNRENLLGRSSAVKKELDVDSKDALLDELLRETSVANHSTLVTPAEAEIDGAHITESTSTLLSDLDALVGRSRKVKDEELDVDSKDAVLDALFQTAFPDQSTTKEGLAKSSHLAEVHCKQEAVTPPLDEEAEAILEGEPNDTPSHNHAAVTDEETSDSSSSNETSSTGDASSDSSMSCAARKLPPKLSRRKRSRPSSSTPETYRRTRRASQGSSSSSGSPRRRRIPNPNSESGSEDSHRRRLRRSPSTESSSSFSSGDDNPRPVARQQMGKDSTSRKSPSLSSINAPILRRPERPAVSSIRDDGAVPVSDDSDIEVLDAPMGLDWSSTKGPHVPRRIRSRPSRRIERATAAPGRAALPSLLALPVRPLTTTIRPIVAVLPFAAQFQSQPVGQFEPNPFAAPAVSQRSSTVPEWLRKDVPPNILNTFVLYPSGGSHESKDVHMLLLGDESSLKPLLTCTDVLVGPRSKHSPSHPFFHHYFTIYAADDVVALKPCVHVLLHDLKPLSFQRMWASIRQILLGRFASVGSLPQATFHFIDQPTQFDLASVRTALGDDIKPSWYNISSAVCAKIEELDLLRWITQDPALAEWTRTLCGSVVLPRQLSFRTDHLRRLPSTCAPSVASVLFKFATWMNWDLLSASKAPSEHRKLPDIMDAVIADDEHLRFLAERFAESTPKLHQFLDFVHRLHTTSVEKLADLRAVDSHCSLGLRRRLAFEHTMRGMSQAIRDVVATRERFEYDDIRWFAERAGQLMAEITAYMISSVEK